MQCSLVNGADSKNHFQKRFWIGQLHNAQIIKNPFLQHITANSEAMSDAIVPSKPIHVLKSFPEKFFATSGQSHHQFAAGIIGIMCDHNDAAVEEEEL